MDTITAVQAFQCCIMDVASHVTRLRLDILDCKGLHRHSFDLESGQTPLMTSPLFQSKYVSDRTIWTQPQLLKHFNVTLGMWQVMLQG
eukprot:scaffold64363_cov26-Cyclotella_meneghiniana.AAC.1